MESRDRGEEASRTGEAESESDDEVKKEDELTRERQDPEALTHGSNVRVVVTWRTVRGEATRRAAVQKSPG